MFQDLCKPSCVGPMFKKVRAAYRRLSLFFDGQLYFHRHVFKIGEIEFASE